MVRVGDSGIVYAHVINEGEKRQKQAAKDTPKIIMRAAMGLNITRAQSSANKPEVERAMSESFPWALDSHCNM